MGKVDWLGKVLPDWPFASLVAWLELALAISEASRVSKQALGFALAPKQPRLSAIEPEAPQQEFQLVQENIRSWCRISDFRQLVRKQGKNDS